MGCTAGFASSTTLSEFDHQHCVGGAAEHSRQRAALVSQRLVGARRLERCRQAAGDQRRDVLVVLRERCASASREEQGAEHLEAPADRHHQRRAEPRSRQRALEVVRPGVGTAEVVHDARLTAAHRASGRTLVGREHARRQRAPVGQRGERVHEISASLRIGQAHRHVVVRQRAAGFVRQRLKEMRRHRRARHGHQQPAQTREPVGETHVRCACAPQCSLTSAVSWAPSGTGSIGPPIEM